MALETRHHLAPDLNHCAMSEYFVKPNLPTILGSQLYHELLPLDLVFAISVRSSF